MQRFGSFMGNMVFSLNLPALLLTKHSCCVYVDHYKTFRLESIYGLAKCSSHRKNHESCLLKSFMVYAVFCKGLQNFSSMYISEDK